MSIIDECDFECPIIQSCTVYKNNGMDWITEKDINECVIENGICLNVTTDIDKGALVFMGANDDLKEPAPTWEWVTRVAGLGEEEDPAIAVDCCGNSYISGAYDSSTLTFYNSDKTIFNTTITESGSSNAFIGKIDSEGVWVWDARVSGVATFTAGIQKPEIAVDCCGSVYSTAIYIDTGIFFDPDNNINFTLTADNEPEVFVSKLNPDGRWSWVTRVSTDRGANTELTEPSIAVDYCGDIYFSVEFDTATTMTFFNRDDTIGYELVLPVGPQNHNIGIARLNTDGYWQWAALVATGGNNQVRLSAPSLAVDCCKYCYIVGRYRDNPLDFYDAGSSTPNSIFTLFSPIGPRNDVFAAKIDENGIWQWTVHVGSEDNDLDMSVAVDCCGNAYVFGRFNNFVATDVLTATFYNVLDVNSGITITGGQVNDLFIGKVNTDGYWEWVAKIITPVLEDAFNIDTDCCGNTVIGFVSLASNVLFYNAGEQLGMTLTLNSVDGDPVFARINPDGIWDWAMYAKTSAIGFQNGNFVGLDKCNNVYTIGVYASDTIQLDFYEQNGTISHTLGKDNADGEDIYIAKIHNDTCLPGVFQGDVCAIFKGVAPVTSATTDLPVQIGRKYYYDRQTNRLSTTCEKLNCCDKCRCANCYKLNSCSGLYAIGLPNNEIYIL